MRAKALEPVTLVRSPTLTNSDPVPMETGSRPDNFMGGTDTDFRRDNRHRLTLGLQVSVVVQNNQELKAPSLTCGALTAAGCNAPWVRA